MLRIWEGISANTIGRWGNKVIRGLLWGQLPLCAIRAWSHWGITFSVDTLAVPPPPKGQRSRDAGTLNLVIHQLGAVLADTLSTSRQWASGDMPKGHFGEEWDIVTILIMMMFSPGYRYLKTHQSAHFKCEQIVVCQFFLNKAFYKSSKDFLEELNKKSKPLPFAWNSI